MDRRIARTRNSLLREQPLESIEIQPITDRALGAMYLYGLIEGIQKQQ